MEHPGQKKPITGSAGMGSGIDELPTESLIDARPLLA
jgi:hypothetical protein